MKTGYILIGPSGSGKSTLVQKLLDENDDAATFSLDLCRLSFLAAEKFSLSREEQIELYKTAFNFANANAKEFDEYVEKEWQSALKHDVVIVDNTNVTRKSRARWSQGLKQKGFKVVMISFLNTIETLIERQSSRPDKSVPTEVVRQQYFRQEQVLLGSECDEFQVR